MKLLSRLCQRCGYYPRGDRAGLTIFMYHSLARTPLPFHWWCCVDAAEFARQLGQIQRHFDILSLTQALTRLREGAFRKPAAVITFDDGFQNNYEIAFPILREAGVPATIFLTTRFIGTDATPWFCRLFQALADARAPSLVWRGQLHDIAQASGKARVYTIIVRDLKELPQPRLQAELRSLVIQLGSDPDAPVLPDSPFRMLSRQALQVMADSGLIGFGAHTHSHAILARLTERERRDEIERSLAWIADFTGEACRVFAYPNGRREDYNASTVAMLRSLGVHAAFTAVPGRIDAGTPMLELPRFGIGANLGVAELVSNTFRRYH